MAKSISIKRGLRIRLQGEAPETSLPASTGEVGGTYALVPEDFVGIIPKLAVREDDHVMAGDPLFYSKTHPQMKFVSPVSGTVVAINRGAKRKIMSIEVKPDSNPQSPEFVSFPTADAKSAEEIKDLLLSSGMWGFIKQRPYDRVADPNLTPRDIFVTAHFTAPLAPNWNYLLVGKENYLEAALVALSKCTPGKVYVGIEEGGKTLSIPNVEFVTVKGPHPAGNVGVLINKLAPINKGETVWTLKATDLLVIGRFLLTGKADFSRTVAITGSDAAQRGYTTIMPGGQIAKERPLSEANNLVRVVAGDPLTGVALDENRPFTSLNIDQITVLPNGSETHELFGWIRPRFNQYSKSRSYFSWLTPGKKYRLDTRVKGGQRAMIMSHELSSVFPMDIYPEYLLKAIIAFDIDKMEELGIYEVAPEDFALCEFVDSSKMELQRIVRAGLDLLYKEMN